MMMPQYSCTQMFLRQCRLEHAAKARSLNSIRHQVSLLHCFYQRYVSIEYCSNIGFRAMPARANS